MYDTCSDNEKITVYCPDERNYIKANPETELVALILINLPNIITTSYNLHLKQFLVAIDFQNRKSPTENQSDKEQIMVKYKTV